MERNENETETERTQKGTLVNVKRKKTEPNWKLFSDPYCILPEAICLLIFLSAVGIVLCTVHVCTPTCIANMGHFFILKRLPEALSCNINGVLLTLGTHAQKGYSTCLVCVCVCLSLCVCVCLLPLQCQHRSFLCSE